MNGPVPRRRVAPLVRRARDPRPGVERILDALGVDPSFTEALLGDMAEEGALREERDGTIAARLWYARELLRSLPHIAWSWVRYSRKHAPQRLVALAAGVAIVPCVVALALALRDGPPARFAGARDGGIVVNSRHPVRLPMTVLDAAGHVLKRVGVRYRWVAGVPATVSPDGVVTCTTRGDARVRVSAGPLATDVPVRCRPVFAVAASEWEMSFVVGEAARPIGVSAIDSAGRLVSPITGTLAIEDTSIASLIQGRDGYRVVPRAPGMTFIRIHVGDLGTSVVVEVYPPAPTLEGIVQSQQRAAVAVRLASGETRQWRLSPGRYDIAMLPSTDRRHVPGLAILGANCVGVNGAPRFVCVAGANSWVIAYHQLRAGLPDTVSGFVALHRAD